MRSAPISKHQRDMHYTLAEQKDAFFFFFGKYEGKGMEMAEVSKIQLVMAEVCRSAQLELVKGGQGDWQQWDIYSLARM
jgi:hypothetical protein